MLDPPTNIAASVKRRLLNMSREQGRLFDILLVRFALERFLFRLSKTIYRESYILKGGMLVTQWLGHGNRETRDIDFLGVRADDRDTLIAIFAEIMSMDTNDGLQFDTEALAATAIREEIQHGGVRLRTSAYLERTRIPIILDIGFGDALADAGQSIDYPSLLGMELPNIRSYPPAAVIAEKFHAVVVLGIANGRMKDFYDLWAISNTIDIPGDKLDAAIETTFQQRKTAVPNQRPVGLSFAMADDNLAQQRWRAFIASLDLPHLEFIKILDDIWELLMPSCARLNNIR